MPRRPTNVELGRSFEAVAEDYLRAQGYEVIDRNVRHGRDEVDLIVRREGVVAFVEVKGRSDARRRYDSPLRAVDAAKRARIECVARWWIRTRPQADGYRFDAVSVEPVEEGSRAGWRVDHVPDAWRPGL